MSPTIPRLYRLQGHHPGRRQRHAAVPVDPVREQAAHARVRQADGLLPPERSDALGHPRGAHHQHAHGPAAVPAALRRRQQLGMEHPVPRAALAGWPGAGFPHRRGFPGRLTGLPHLGGQPVLRARPLRRAAPHRHAHRGRDDLRLPRGRPGGVWRGRVRVRMAAYCRLEEKPAAPKQRTTPFPDCTSTMAAWSSRPDASSPARAANWKSPTSTGSTSKRAPCSSNAWGAAPPGWTRARTIRCSKPRTSCRPSSTGRASKLACIEEIAYEQGWIDHAGLADLIKNLGKTEYANYLRHLAAERVDGKR